MDNVAKIEYMICESDCAGGLEIEVMKAILNGFSPIGGVSQTGKLGDYQIWAQAMIRQIVDGVVKSNVNGESQYMTRARRNAKDI